MAVGCRKFSPVPLLAVKCCESKISEAMPSPRRQTQLANSVKRLKIFFGNKANTTGTAVKMRNCRLKGPPLFI
jgi:hypothetical protein